MLNFDSSQNKIRNLWEKREKGEVIMLRVVMKREKVRSLKIEFVWKGKERVKSAVG